MPMNKSSEEHERDKVAKNENLCVCPHVCVCVLVWMRGSQKWLEEQWPPHRPEGEKANDSLFCCCLGDNT